MTNEVLQKTASDEQNVSSSNGLEAKLPYIKFSTSQWQQKNFSDLFTILSNNTHSRAELTNYGTIRNIHYGDVLIKFGNILDTSQAEIPYLCENCKYKDEYMQDGDIIIADTAEDYTAGKCTELFNVGTSKIISGLHTIPCRPKIKFAQKYLGYYTNSPAYRHQLLSLLQGIKVYSISKTNLSNTHVSYPPLPEQQKIADFLSLVDQRIEKQRQLVESLKKYKRGLFLKLYNDSDKSIISFKNIYEMASEGGTPSTSDSENYENGKIPFIKIDDLNQHYLNFAKYFITEKGLKKSSAWIVPENSIIYSNGATIGACSINKIPVTTKQGILGIVPKSNFSVEFLYFFFTSSIFKQKIRAITTKGTMDCAYLKDINGIKISIPDFIAQQKIAKIMVDFENLIERTELSFIYLQNIKKALLQQMFI